jgi:dihydroflavonol-4-reductase
MLRRTVLVTGGSGFIGQWCIVELLRRGYDVRTTIRSAQKESSVRSAVATAVEVDGRLTCFVADLTSDHGWRDAVDGCDFVLHVASPLGTGIPGNPDDIVVPARDGALRVLRSAIDAGVQRVVMTSADRPARRGVRADPHDRQPGLRARDRSHVERRHAGHTEDRARSRRCP